MQLPFLWPDTSTSNLRNCFSESRIPCELAANAIPVFTTGARLLPRSSWSCVVCTGKVWARHVFGSTILHSGVRMAKVHELLFSTEHRIHCYSLPFPSIFSQGVVALGSETARCTEDLQREAMAYPRTYKGGRAGFLHGSSNFFVHFMFLYWGLYC